MNKGGRKYRLLGYEYVLNRWWPVTLLLAFFIFLNVGVLWGAQMYYSTRGENPFQVLAPEGGVVMLGVGGICLLFSLFLLVARKMAYVQLFDDHLRLVTPFLRLNISYKRFQRSITTQLYNLFPPKTISGWKRELVEPIMGTTVIVIYLNSFPLPRATLRLFLSPLFFHDDSPHFVLILDDWMRFSTELDSRRSQGRNPRRQPLPGPRNTPGLLDDLKRK
ncbi:MAG TPA: hypothetical protein VGK00_08105 [Anaerolineales bacterium]|jgi:hypothetical protein